jgi:hypothetical protein
MAAHSTNFTVSVKELIVSLDPRHSWGIKVPGCHTSSRSVSMVGSHHRVLDRVQHTTGAQQVCGDYEQ